jgi:hypothetical protein
MKHVLALQHASFSSSSSLTEHLLFRVGTAFSKMEHASLAMGLLACPLHAYLVVSKRPCDLLQLSPHQC